MKLIRYYGNRKMYDTETHKYVNLAEIREFIKDEIEFMVYDCKTKKDKTDLVYAEAFFKAVKEGKVHLDRDWVYSYLRSF